MEAGIHKWGSIRRSSWLSPEFIFYLLYAAHFYYLFLVQSISLSNKFAALPGGLYGLRSGWLFGRQVDLSDHQWRTFRSSLPLLATAMLVLCSIGRWGLGALSKLLNWSSLSKATQIYWLLVSSVFMVYLHGFSSIHVALLAASNYLLVWALKGHRYFLGILWGYHCTVFVVVRAYEGLPFTMLISALPASLGESWGPVFAWMDGHRGVFRWHICYNLLLLRMISYGSDIHWGLQNASKSLGLSPRSSRDTHFLLEVPKSPPLALSLSAAASPQLYACFLFFAPLYLAGPIISFHSFVSQIVGLDVKVGGAPTRPASCSPPSLALYGARTVLPLALLELMLHWCYFPALAQGELWRSMTPVQLCLLSYGTLNFVWLKFLTIWRLSRFWSLVAGIDPPENMLRCLSNNYTVQAFWRGWHASYNRWLVLYMYVPLGGNKWKAANVWVIFTFVALWHDLEWKLLGWAWLMSLLLLPELAVTWAADQPPFKDLQGTRIMTEATAFLGAVNIMGLMLANLVGFVVGPTGASEIVSRLLAPDSRWLLLYLLLSLDIGVKLMLRSRGSKRRGVGEAMDGGAHQIEDQGRGSRILLVGDRLLRSTRSLERTEAQTEAVGQSVTSSFGEKKKRTHRHQS